MPPPPCDSIQRMLRRAVRRGETQSHAPQAYVHVSSFTGWIMRLVLYGLVLWAGVAIGLAQAQTPTFANVEYARVNNQPMRLDLNVPNAPASGRPLADNGVGDNGVRAR